MTTTKVEQDTSHSFTTSAGAKMKYRTMNAGNPLSHNVVDTNFELLRLAVNGLVDDVGTQLTTNDLTSYAQLSDVPDPYSASNTTGYIQIGDIPTPYVAGSNPDGYIQYSMLPDVSGYLTSSDLSGYITTQELTNYNFQTAPAEGSSFALTTALSSSSDRSNWNDAHGWGDHADAGYLTSAPETDLSNYYTKNEVDNLIPEDVNLSNYVTTNQVSSEVTSALGTSSINDLSDVQTTGTDHVPTDGQALVWKATHNDGQGHWMPGTVATDVTGIPTFTYNASLKTLTINT